MNGYGGQDHEPEKPEPRIWSRELATGEGDSGSVQLHMLYVGPDRDNCTPTGIIRKTVLTRDGSAVEVEGAFVYGGRYYASVRDALLAWDAVGRPIWIEPADPTWTVMV